MFLKDFSLRKKMSYKVTLKTTTVKSQFFFYYNSKDGKR